MGSNFQLYWAGFRVTIFADPALNLAGNENMQPQQEHEFDFDEEEVIVGLSESLYRFAIMTGVVGLALVGLGAGAIAMGSYGGGLAGPSIVVLGLVAIVGSLLFLRPRGDFDEVLVTRGSDISKLMQGVDALSVAHGTFRLVLVVFVLVRLGSFLLGRIG